MSINVRTERYNSDIGTRVFAGGSAARNRLSLAEVTASKAVQFYLDIQWQTNTSGNIDFQLEKLIGGRNGSEWIPILARNSVNGSDAAPALRQTGPANSTDTYLQKWDVDMPGSYRVTAAGSSNGVRADVHLFLEGF